MKIHRANRQAMRIVKKAGFDCHAVGTLALHIVSKEYSPRPLIVDVVRYGIPDDDTFRIDVCEFSDCHPLWKQAMEKIHNQRFHSPE